MKAKTTLKGNEILGSNQQVSCPWAWHVVVLKFDKNIYHVLVQIVCFLVFFLQALCSSLVNVQLNYIDLIHYINNYLAIILYYFNDWNENRCALPFHFSALESWLCCNCWPFCVYHKSCTWILRSISKNDDKKMTRLAGVKRLYWMVVKVYDIV
jgi:hypothetical protein